MTVPAITVAPVAIAVRGEHRLDPALFDIASAAALVDGSSARALKVAISLDNVPLPGGGETAGRWELLATLGAHDLTAARVCEVQLDALAIIAEAAEAGLLPRFAPLDAPHRQTWGVFAAEGPAGRLTATGAADGEHSVSGVKPWCSIAGSLSRALVTAYVSADSPDERALFAVDLTHPGVSVEPVEWVSRGLVDVPSGPIACDDVPAAPLGPPGWYLDRPGFWWGGVGVAACWYGGAVGLTRRLSASVATALEPGRRPPDQIAYAALGSVDAALHGARAALAYAAEAADDDPGRPDAQAIAMRTRSIVATAVDTVLATVAHATGPAPLTFDNWHARHVADLQVYVRQHHAGRDDAALGRLLAQPQQSPA